MEVSAQSDRFINLASITYMAHYGFKYTDSQKIEYFTKNFLNTGDILRQGFNRR